MANESLFTSQIPASNNQFDGSSEVLGTTLTFARSGVVRGIRFRAPVTTTGTFEGALYQVTSGDGSPAGTLVSELATFGALTSDAWNTVMFTVPVNVSSGVAYRPAVRTSQGRYCFTGAFFTGSSLTNGNITGIQDNTNPVGLGSNLRNGVFATSGSMTYPSNTFNGNCYFVDVIYEADRAVQTIFTSQLPSVPNGSDATPYTLGTYFTPNIDCQAIAGRFRAPSTVAGVSFTHVLYSVTDNTSGVEIGRQAYAAPVASQWNAVAFGSPIDLTANQYYCTSYFTTDRFVASSGFFTSAAVVNGHLTANQDTVPYDNGRIHIGGDAFPELGASNASCYFADIVIEFSTATTIGAQPGTASPDGAPAALTIGTLLAGQPGASHPDGTPTALTIGTVLAGQPGTASPDGALAALTIGTLLAGQPGASHPDGAPAALVLNAGTIALNAQPGTASPAGGMAALTGVLSVRVPELGGTATTLDLGGSATVLGLGGTAEIA